MIPGSALLIALAFLSPRDSVYGVVRDGVTGVPLAGVEVSQASGPTDLTGAEGQYSLAASSTGPLSINFQRHGYQPLRVEVRVAPGSSLRVDLALDPLPVPLPALEVASRTPASTRVRPASAGWLNIGAYDLRPGGSWSNPLLEADDPILAAASVTGAGSSGFPTAQHVHGGGADQNLLLLDGLPVFGGTHVGGVAGVINPDVIAGVRLDAGVAPAEYGGRLSSVMDVQLREPASHVVEWSGTADAREVRQSLGIPLGDRSSLLLSGTRNYRGVFAQDGYGLEQNGFYDLLLRGSLELKHDPVRVYLLRYADRLTFPAAAVPPTDGEQDIAGPANQFRWTGQTAGAVWTHLAGNGRVTTRLWRATAGAGLDWLGGGISRVASNLSETGVSSDLFAGDGGSSYQIGMSVQRTSAGYVVSSDSGFALEASPLLLAAFAESRRSRGRWLVSAGLRANSIDGGTPAIEPRLSVRYRFSPAGTLSLGAARNHQYLQSMRNEESLLDHLVGAEFPVANGGNAPAARSDQLMGELGIRATPALSLTLSGYGRRFTALLAPPLAGAGPVALTAPPRVDGYAAGAELLVSYRVRGTALALDLGMAESDRQRGRLEFDPTSSRARWLSIGASRTLHGGVLLRLRSSIASGAPTSVFQGSLEWQSPAGFGASGEVSGSPDRIFGSVDGAFLPTYRRTDLGVMRAWTVAFGRRPGMLTTSATITNLFNDHNILGYIVAAPGGVRRSVAFPSRALTAQVSWGF
jgi:hypothetical protein